jgi:hypothetical protein
MTWLLIVTLVGGGVDFVGPFSTRGECERARAQILYVDRQVQSAFCEPRV